MTGTTELEYCEIERNENYLVAPDVALASDSSLVCVYREGNAHSPKWSRIVLKVSGDLGKTWSHLRILADSSLHEDGYCWNCPRISVLPDGRLVILCDYQDESPERAVWAWWSEDNGRSWSEPRQITARGLCPDRVVATDSGRLLLVVPCSEAGLLLFESNDGGASWKALSEIRPAVPPKSAETTLVVLDEKRMVCYSRDDGALGPKSISRDGGTTWNDRCKSCFVGHRPCGGLLESGHVLVTYRFPGGGTYAYLENRQSALDPNCWTQHGAVLRLEDAGANYFWDYGYSGWVQLPDSRVFCVYHTKPPVDRLPSPPVPPKKTIRIYSAVL